MHGSYRELRAAEARKRQQQQPRTAPKPDEFYIPETTPSAAPPSTDPDPFGLGPAVEDNPFGEPLPVVPAPIESPSPAVDPDPFGLDTP
jgi:hypothetical protein